MINRVTQQTVQRSTMTNMQRNLSQMSDLQSQLSSGKRITKASDDPGAVSRAMAVRAERAAATQAARNISDGGSWLAQIDTTLQSSVSALRRARDLTVQGANEGAMGQTSRDAIATEIEGIRDALLDLANTKINGRLVFAGTSDDAVAFEDGASATPYQWNGSTTGTVERRLSPTATVRVDANGEAAFGAGATSVFALLDNIATDLRNGVNVSSRLNEIDTHLDGMLSQLADVGIRYRQVTDAETALQVTIQDYTSTISGLEDIDLAATIVELKMQEVAYQGALGASARVLQPTLMDFLS